MTEAEYSLMADLATLRAAESLLRNTLPQTNEDHGDLRGALKAIDRWRKRLEKEVDKRMTD